MFKRNLKRFCAAAIAVLLLAAALPMTVFAADAGFSDVSAGNACYDAVTYMADQGYILGYGDGTFRPERDITRAEAVTILYRMAGEPEVADPAQFSDVSASSWYAAPVAWAQASGVVLGYGNGKFGPNDVITGEQTNLILDRMGEKVSHLSPSIVSGKAAGGTAEMTRGGFASAAYDFAYVIDQLATLQATLAPVIETDGLSAGELYAKGQAYENGEGVVQWYAMAAAYYEAAAKAGSTEAEAAIDALDAYKAEMLASGEQGDVFKFFQSGTQAGQSGNYELAYAISYDDAFFFEDPVRRGIGELGNMLSAGNGVEQDIEKAIDVYTFQAKILKNGKGYSGLGALYDPENGTYPGITPSIDKAIKNYRLSYEAEGLGETDFKGPRYVADYYDAGFDHDDGTHEEPDYLIAKKYYEIAAAGNGRTYDATACYKLGTYYEEGRTGIKQDYARAADYYVKAISDRNTHATQLGVPQTYLALGRFYEEGLGVEKNAETAVEYYQKALDAAEENLALSEAAGNNEEMQGVYDAAEAALARLS